VGKQDDWQFRAKSAQPAQDMQAVSVSARQLEHEQVRYYAGLDPFHGFPTATRGFEMPGIGFSNGPERPKNSGLSAHHQQAYFFDCMFCHGRGGSFGDHTKV
jgi:hypothetical protein